MVDRLLALKGRLEAVLASSFGGSQAFGGTLRDALSYALNTRCAPPHRARVAAVQCTPLRMR
jgi:hypothetical protein